jgi:hypothetical protein
MEMVETRIWRKSICYDGLALRKCGLFENVETTMQHFRAFYEDAARTEAAARAEGYNGEDGSLMDYVEPSDYRTGKTFPTLTQAEQWLKEQIDAMKTVFGCGNIVEQEPVTRRCRYCVCGGVRSLHEYTVDDTGIVEDEALEDSCLN